MHLTKLFYWQVLFVGENGVRAHGLQGHGHHHACQEVEHQAPRAHRYTSIAYNRPI